ncbi:MAG: hypothetical protein HY649_01940 [Acidobacteria bacterium]|nr:hypothetical protein [Acidobacteriota bacterium]
MPSTETPREILLVGSVGLRSAEEVFRAVSAAIGDRLRRIPDGETGERTQWIVWQRRVVENHPAFELDPVELAAGGRITSEVEGVRHWKGSDQVAAEAPPPPRMRLRQGISPSDVKFGKLGFAEVAKDSYSLFVKLRNDGVIRRETRFQVSLPTTAAFLNAHVVYAHHAAVEAPYRDALFQEVAEIAGSIPHQDLAMQWDVSTEMGQWEGVRHAYFSDVKLGVVERLARHCNQIPPDIEMGIHLCYGSWGNRHWMEPKSAANMVAVFNGVSPFVQRKIHWLHMPVPRDRTDDAYFEPLKSLQLRPETRLYLGLIHLTDGVPGTRKRIEVASRYAPDFGIATECGFGRRPPETIPDLLQVHKEV